MWRLAVALFTLLLSFWFMLSSQYNALFIGMGVASALLVTALTLPIVATVLGEHSPPLSREPARLWRFALYLGWLLWRIVVSGLQVAWIVVNPRVPPEPRMLRFETNMRSHLARVMLANTISLVPGTLTVRLDEREYLVHALVPAAAEDLLDGRMQSRIARVFFEEPEQAVNPRWEDALEIRS
jgi:multicomponent Na+:H+ antiporter subunit E